jgi:saccharopine dehydrogenase-like NADP-dependent oxidoreductase
MNNFKVLVLGGAGTMAAYVIHTLMKYTDLHIELILADKKSEKVKQAAKYCNAEALQLDIADQSALNKALSNSDLVINMIGPYHIHTVNIAKTAISMGCHYFDVCDDDRPTWEILKLDKLAKKNKVLVLMGIGASPGLTNIFARKAVSLLDQVDTLFAGWGDHPLANKTYVPKSETIPLPPGEGLATYQHLFQLAHEKTHVVEQHELVEVSPFTRKLFHIPGAGKVPLTLIAHPEAVGLAKQYKNRVSNIYTVGVLYPSDYEFLKKVYEASIGGKVNEKDVAELFKSGTSKEQNKLIPAPQMLSLIFKGLTEIFLPSKKKIPLLFSGAYGLKDGQKTHVLVGTKPINQMHLTGMCTGAPIAVAVAKLLRNDIKNHHGVYTPDQLFEPDNFLNELAVRITPPLIKGEDLYQVITESANQ